MFKNRLLSSSIWYRIFALLLICPVVSADELDDLLSAIDQDIIAKRLSKPVGNNAIDKIRQFKALAPFDSRVNEKAYTVAESYIDLASKRMAKNQLQQAQAYLNIAWDIAYLAEGIEEAQNELDKKMAKAGIKPILTTTVPSIAVAPKAKTEKPKPTPKPKAVAKPKPAAKKNEPTKVGKPVPPAQKAAATIAAAAPVAQTPKVEAPVAQAAPKPEPKPVEKKEPKKTKPLATYSIAQTIIENKDRKALKGDLQPICEHILKDNTSVVLKTRTQQEYRWLTVRLTLCLRRLDKSFRLRHSRETQNIGDAIIALHPQSTAGFN